MSTHIEVEINGQSYARTIEPRLLLSDFIRHDLRLTGTHVGCEHGVCGACTVLFDGEPVRACLMLAVQADGHRIRTVEGLAEDGRLTPLQEAFRACHGLQCGFCTPGFLMTLEPVVDAGVKLTDDEVREVISGNLCRCTGYQQIVEAVQLALADTTGGEAVSCPHSSGEKDQAGDTRVFPHSDKSTPRLVPRCTVGPAPRTED